MKLKAGKKPDFREALYGNRGLGGKKLTRSLVSVN